MKKFLKSRVFVAIITAVICITGTTYAANEILASSITYKNTTVDKALDELYNKANKKNGIGKAFYTITTSDTTYTATKDCILYIYGHWNSGGYAAYVYINGESVKTTNELGEELDIGSSDGKRSHIMYINKGDVISTRSGIAGLTYLLEFYDYE